MPRRNGASVRGACDVGGLGNNGITCYAIFNGIMLATILIGVFSIAYYERNKPITSPAVDLEILNHTIIQGLAEYFDDKIHKCVFVVFLAATTVVIVIATMCSY